jgi:hypothetical protein
MTCNKLKYWLCIRLNTTSKLILASWILRRIYAPKNSGLTRRMLSIMLTCMGLTPKSSNPFRGPLVASTAIEDFSGELVHDFDQSFLWRSTDHEPARRFPTHRNRARNAKNAPRWGVGFMDWMRDNYTRILTM